MKYYIISGEASGDLHGANLIKGLRKSDPQAEFRFWGGDLMAEAGGGENLVKHYKDASFFGFVEIVRNLGTIFSQLSECRKDVEAFAPDVLILIDYAGFNLKMAKYAKRKGLRTFFYISPKVWAWKESRVKKIKKYVDKLFVIFPFEIQYYRDKGVEVIYEGNPLMDSLADKMAKVPPRDKFLEDNGLDSRPIVALLAGSRKTEIKNSLPFMVELAGRFPEHQFVVAGVSWLDRSVYEGFIRNTCVKYVCDKTYEILKYADAAVVTSGTATLETALIGTPEIVCYHGDSLSVWIARQLIKVRFISLVNLIMDRETVRELIQRDMTMANAETELNAILPGGVKRAKMLAEFDELREKIGGPGASDRFAARMVELLETP